MSEPVENRDLTAGGAVTAGSAALLASLIRTVVPLVVGYIVAALTKWGVPVNADDVANLVNGFVSAGLALAYYLLVRLAEVFGSSKFGWLLGFAKAPIYKAGPPATIS